MTEQKRYLLRRRLLMTLDPVHPGAGGYRLGRVDNSIAREPGTRLPKIPGSSLHGAARQYADLLARENGKKATCAGQNACGQPDCPICYTFGYVHVRDNASVSGVVSISDARLLLFPVHTLNGPMWVSTVERLREACFENLPDAPQDEEVLLSTKPKDLDRLNLGWLLLEASAAADSIQPPPEWTQNAAWEQIHNRLALVSVSLFSHIVNSNLEVRTSVAIDPQTGAAEEGALYTYEAIPRAAFLTVDVMLDDYRDRFPSKNGWKTPLDVVAAGFDMMQYPGVGGMGTRGFGRLKPLGKPLETDPLQDRQEAHP
jgi:CRISPR-associated protein Cmr4